MAPFNIAGISFRPTLWKEDENLEVLITHLRSVAKQDVQLVATVEGCLDEYLTKDLPRLRLQSGLPRKTTESKSYKKRLEAFKKKQIALADRIKEKCLPVLRDEAASHGIYLFVNTLEHRRGRTVYNTTFVINPAGKVIGTYDKIHAGFETGNSQGKHYSVFHTSLGCVGTLICADRNYPETSRILALSGARLQVINSYGYWGEGNNNVMLKQRARENGVYVFFVHPNESVVFSPEGRVAASSCSWEPTLVRSVDLSQTGMRGSRTLTIPEGLVKHYEG